MKYNNIYLTVCAIGIIAVVFALFNVNCQYEYESPQPGIMEINLGTYSTGIPFFWINAQGDTGTNSFEISIASLKAIRSDGAQAVIFPDIKAIESKTMIVNTLDVRAYNLSLIIGQTFVPPGDYIGVLMLIEPKKEVILNGYQNINVERPEDFQPLLRFEKNFRVNEGQITKILLTIDLDKSLVRGAFRYKFSPSYNITIQ
ncbi:MAG: hypothetical protein QME52_04095 [Bacteroidota bacterium]|nr:hypothetical protein [Bacteroidota bacterium]